MTLLGLVRRPSSWAYVLLVAVALVALGDGVVLLVHAAWTGPASAAGWFVGGTGLVLAILTGLAVREDVVGGDRSVMTQLAEVIVSEEEDAGRDVGDRFQADAEPLPPREARRVLIVSAALMIAWMVAMPWVGFGAATALMCAAFILLVARRRIWVALVAGVLIGVGLAILFTLSGVILPTGALWHLL